MAAIECGDYSLEVGKGMSEPSTDQFGLYLYMDDHKYYRIKSIDQKIENGRKALINSAALSSKSNSKWVETVKELCSAHIIKGIADGNHEVEHIHIALPRGLGGGDTYKTQSGFAGITTGSYMNYGIDMFPRIGQCAQFVVYGSKYAYDRQTLQFDGMVYYKEFWQSLFSECGTNHLELLLDNQAPIVLKIYDARAYDDLIIIDPDLAELIEIRVEHFSNKDRMKYPPAAKATFAISLEDRSTPSHIEVPNCSFVEFQFPNMQLIYNAHSDQLVGSVPLIEPSPKHVTINLNTIFKTRDSGIPNLFIDKTFAMRIFSAMRTIAGMATTVKVELDPAKVPVAMHGSREKSREYFGNKRYDRNRHQLTEYPKELFDMQVPVLEKYTRRNLSKKEVTMFCLSLAKLWDIDTNKR